MTTLTYNHFVGEENYRTISTFTINGPKVFYTPVWHIHIKTTPSIFEAIAANRHAAKKFSSMRVTRRRR